MDKSAIVRDAAERLFTTEDAVDRALTSAVKLMEALVIARRELDLPEVSGDEACRRVSGLIAALAEARRETLGAHGALDRAQAWVGGEVRTFTASPPPGEDRREPPQRALAGPGGWLRPV